MAQSSESLEFVFEVHFGDAEVISETPGELPPATDTSEQCQSSTEEWIDPKTCAWKKCSQCGSPEIVAVGCKKNISCDMNPLEDCVHLNESGYSCVYAGKNYSNCVCKPFDKEHGISLPVTCNGHEVGETYESACNIVKCMDNGKELILIRRCQAANGTCVDHGTTDYTCFITGYLRGSCKCNDGCNQLHVVQRNYRAEIIYSKPIPAGTVVISMSGTVNNSPLEELDTTPNRLESSKTFSTQDVGIPRKLIFQLLNDKVTARKGGTLKSITVYDIDNGNKKYEFNTLGANKHSNGQSDGENGWVSNHEWKYLESDCISPECQGTEVFDQEDMYNITVHCPFVKNIASEISLDEVKIGWLGEHRFTGLVDLSNPSLQTIDDKTFTSKYKVPYSGRVISMAFHFSGPKWTPSCTVRLNIMKRGMYYQFEYRSDERNEKAIVLPCVQSSHCGNPNWDMVCDGNELAKWCQEDVCCKKAEVSCGRLCYELKKPYRGKTRKAKGGQTCETNCSNADNLNAPPTCLSHNEKVECDIPACLKFQCLNDTQCYALLDVMGTRTEAKDMCFVNFGGRLIMVNDKVKYYDTLLAKFIPKNSPYVPNVWKLGIWAEGFYDYRSPTQWGLIKKVLLPDYLSKVHPLYVNEHSKDVYLTTRDNGELDTCSYGINNVLYSSNCIRAARPLCEFKYG